MTPQFLRAEAARFREMAEASEREASRQRLLGMAADYEERAKTAVQTQPVEEDVEPTPEASEASTDSADEPGEAKTERKRPGGRTLRLAR